VRTEIRFAGVGGQGNILAGEWLALAAHSMGKHAVQSPTYTAQVRGGPTSVDVLFDDKEIIFPRLEAVEFFLCLAQRAWDVFARQLRPDAIIVIDPYLVKHITPGPQSVYRVPVVQITKATVERIVYTSAVALGVFCHLMPEAIPRSVMMNTIRENAPAGHIENNIKAFMAGWNAIENIQPEPRDKVAKKLEEAATLG
jgi:2-oxoglutarate ferredoxin oxidoreductase subunit gamma